METITATVARGPSIARVAIATEVVVLSSSDRQWARLGATKEQIVPVAGAGAVKRLPHAIVEIEQRLTDAAADFTLAVN